MGFNRMNNIGGWAAFTIAFIVYLLTMEPTTSLWDCGEFISTANKLQVPHPPGAPLFVLLGRLFIILFGDNPANAAKAVNAMSATVSALSILFLFWTITYFAGRIILKQRTEPNKNQSLLIIATGLIGSLAYAFSDSFWFSAVEGEVYALSSFFTALVFWAMLKWERRAELPIGNRWLIFIFFMVGLSIGVHLLNLLSIPAIVMVYYFRKYKPTYKGAFIAFVIGCIITGFIQKFIIQYTIKSAAWMDIQFVNVFNLPFFSGFAAFFVLLAAGLYFLLRYSVRKKYQLLNIGIWSMFFILIGYSTYLTTMIRSNADVAIDMYNIDNPVSLGGYLGRERYNDWPILFGPDFTDRAPYSVEGDQYIKGKNKYEIAGKKVQQEWGNAPSSHFFPRMWDNSNDRQQELVYRRFAGMGPDDSPTMRDNMKFFMNYQAGWMYMRYFMWNFAGKQNDLQGFGSVRDSNWISGIKFIDNVRLGDQDKMPETIHVNNKGYNRLFMLPLILGIAGLFIQYKKKRSDLLINALFFLFTGMAIVFYLNQSGIQPRERDYAYVGSFYVFAIWIGLGVIVVNDLFARLMKQNYATISAGLICLIAVPLWMAHEEWDDHDRSQKTFARDMAKNYLESCPPNAILFTYEDNDTYPLWYAQEVEGIRPDVRVMVNTLASSDWFLDQLRYKINKSDPFNVVFTPEQMKGDNREIMYYAEMPGFDKNKFYDLPSAMKNILASDDPKYITTSEEGIDYNLTPVRKFTMPVDKNAAVQSGVVKANENIADEIQIDLSHKTYLLKSDLLMLALISNGDWSRPICFTSISGPQDLGIDKYIRQEGLTYRLVPVKAEGNEIPVNYELAYHNMMNKFEFGASGKKGIYYDEENRRRLNIIRLAYAQVAIDLANIGEKEKARKLLNRFDQAYSQEDYSYGMTSNRNNQHDGIATQFLLASYLAEDKMLANKISASIKKDLSQQINYYESFDDGIFENDRTSSYQLLKAIDDWEKKL